MGRTKRNFNRKGRQVVDDADVRKAHNIPCVELAIDLPSARQNSRNTAGGGEDDAMHSNALVLPSKRKTNEKNKQSEKRNLPKQLNKKQRKKLQTVVEKKEKNLKVR